ncbi:DUF1259 domain-containing protein [Bacillus sp. S/N-304-OC-R1]|uniref:DUF1259 domain-containing protein n=1 Tax=Bacillus sp. S/N-304-OC-R1 TaxID=2758034 RepID=UPI001C8DEE7E|nr:DUF1259 domain-containing protein [Bacillus sp. S/N-304-OC-R1]MBY0120438.1 DUF1259 domain-containing protein [Bacillus sp. S/N-304-OC-R1]
MDHLLCTQFAKILNGNGKLNNGVCSVEMQRDFKVSVQGRLTSSVVPAGVSFEALDHEGNALNLAEIAILEEEIPGFMHAVVGQGIIVSALHNHWVFTKPNILYIHLQSVEPPLNFANKLAYAFHALKSKPIRKE